MTFRLELKQHLPQATRTKSLNFLREVRAAALWAEVFPTHGLSVLSFVNRQHSLQSISASCDFPDTALPDRLVPKDELMIRPLDALRDNPKDSINSLNAGAYTGA